MSITNRMKEKSAAILAATKAATGAPQPGKDVVAPKSSTGGSLTAPGGLAIFRQEMLNRDATVQSLESELAQFREGVRTVKISTGAVSPSKWANRHQTSFQSRAFEQFKEEIAHAGGNIQPILVRPAPGKPGRYEVVFGHRRFAACEQLGIEVLAMVMDLTDEQLFTLMDRENRNREDLSPFEAGVMWRKALDDGLFPSARQLALSLGVSHAVVNNYVDIARLPDSVLALFSTPTEIQARWVKPIKYLLQADPELLQGRVTKIQAIGKSLPSAKIFEMLTASEDVAKKPPAVALKHEGRVVGKMTHGLDGEVVLSIRSGLVSVEAFSRLQEEVQKLIGT